MNDCRYIINDYIKGKITYKEALNRLLSISDKDDKRKKNMKYFNQLKCIRDDFIDGGFYPANLHLNKLKSW